MLRVAIVEDDPLFAEQLKSYMDRFSQENHIEMELTLFPDGLEIVEDYRPVWDLILMDIEMPHLDGMEAAERIRRLDSSVVLIFITNMARCAIKGYEVDALDFILKPVKYPSLALKLRRAMTVIRSHERRFPMVNIDRENIRIPTDDILYIEVLDHMLHIHAESGETVARGAIREGNGRSARIWLDLILKKELGQVVDWSRVDQEDYLLAMERSPIRDTEIKAVLRAALTDKINDREVYMKGIDNSYYYERYSAYKTGDLT